MTQHTSMIGNGNIVFQWASVNDPPEFFAIEPQTMIDARFDPTPVVTQLIDTLRAQNCLMLSGLRYREHEWLARSIAWTVSQTTTENATQSEPAVKEWVNGIGQQRLLVELEKEKEPTIFILPNVTPDDLNCDLGSFIQIAKRHHLIMFTEADPGDWHLNQSQRQNYWRDLKPEAVFPTDLIAQQLVEALLDKQEHLIWLGAEVHTGVVLGDTTTVAEIATELGSPVLIDDFLLELGRLDLRPNDATLRQLIHEVRKGKNRITKWYQGLSENMRQMLVGMVFLDGVSSPQFFAAMDHFVDTILRPRCPNLKHLDLHDLLRLDQVFSIDDGLIRIHDAELRRELITLLWQNHRRLMQLTLVQMVNLVKCSAERDYSHTGPSESESEVVAAEAVPLAEEDREAEGLHWQEEGTKKDLFATPARRRRFRHAMARTLSEIGRRSPSFVERSLFELAAAKDSEIRKVGADAMAMWRESETPDAGNIGEIGLFRQLKRWNSDTYGLAAIERILAAVRALDPHQVDGTPRQTLRVAVAQIAATATLYDPPGAMDGRLQTLLKDIGGEWSSDYVADAFSTLVPLVLQRHAHGMVDLIKEWVMNARRIQYLAYGLALFRHAYPEQAAKLLQTLHREALAAPARRKNDPPGYREALFGLLALYHGMLEDDTAQALQEALQLWQEVLKQEYNPFPRNAVILAVSWRAKQNLNALDPIFGRLIEHIVKGEEAHLIHCMVALYLEQRQRQVGATHRLKVTHQARTDSERDIYWIGLWPDETRPHTAIELKATEWVNTGNPATVRFASKCQKALKDEVDEAEKRACEKILEEREARKKADKEDKKTRSWMETIGPNIGTDIPVNLQSALVILCTRDRRVRQKLLRLMPEAWNDLSHLRKLTIDRSDEPIALRIYKQGRRLYYLNKLRWVWGPGLSLTVLILLIRL